jgi:hypothetical protein
MAEPGVARRSGSAMLLHLWVQSKEMANSPGAAFVLEPAFAKPTARQALALPALLRYQYQCWTALNPI